MSNAFNNTPINETAQGRATITDNFDHVQIVIPAVRSAGTMAFCTIWLIGWMFGGFFAVNALYADLTSGQEFNNYFMAFWVVGWFIGLVMVSQLFIWMLIGKEEINAGQGMLTINKKFLLLQKPKTYDLSQVTNIRVGQDNSVGMFSVGGERRRRDVRDFTNGGSIHFDYGMKTIKFAQGVDEAEANDIIKQVMGKRLTSSWKI